MLLFGAVLDGIGDRGSGEDLELHVEGSLQDSQALHTAEFDLLVASFQGDVMLKCRCPFLCPEMHHQTTPCFPSLACYVPQKEEAPYPTHSPAALKVFSWEGALVFFLAQIGFSGSSFSLFLLVLNLLKRSAQHPQQHLPSCPVASQLIPPDSSLHLSPTPAIAWLTHTPPMA